MTDSTQRPDVIRREGDPMRWARNMLHILLGEHDQVEGPVLLDDWTQWEFEAEETAQPPPRAARSSTPTATGDQFYLRGLASAERRICERCHKRWSKHVDHIDGDRANRARSNLQALCRSCHSRKTAQFDGGFGNTRRPR